MFAATAYILAEQRTAELERYGLGPISRQTRTAQIGTRGTFVLPERSAAVVREVVQTVAGFESESESATSTMKEQTMETQHTSETSPLNGETAPPQPGFFARFTQNLRWPTTRETLIGVAVLGLTVATYCYMAGDVGDVSDIAAPPA